MDSPGAATRQRPLKQSLPTYRLHCGRSARRFSTPWLSRSACRSPRPIAYKIRSHRANDVGTRPGSPPGAAHHARGPSEEASPPVPAEGTCEPRFVRCPQRSPALAESTDGQPAPSRNTRSLHVRSRCAFPNRGIDGRVARGIEHPRAPDRSGHPRAPDRLDHPRAPDRSRGLTRGRRRRAGPYPSSRGLKGPGRARHRARRCDCPRRRRRREAGRRAPRRRRGASRR